MSWMNKVRVSIVLVCVKIKGEILWCPKTWNKSLCCLILFYLNNSSHYIIFTLDLFLNSIKILIYINQIC